MNRWVEITFDCLPLRSISRLDIPLDASPKYRQRCQYLKQAMAKHGSHNSYYLYNARCIYHLVNDDNAGMLEFRFEGIALTDPQDKHCKQCDLQVEMVKETVDWLTEPVVHWFSETVPRSVAVEFDRFIEAGDLEQTRQRIAKIESASDEAGGFVGMYL